jgi:hypothetical protein
MSNAVEIKFNKLRADYLATMAKLTEFRATLASKYGPNYLNSWMRPAEIAKLNKLGDAADKCSNAFTEHLESFSPRDWSYDVPAYWVRETLTFADAMRPLDEPLSVVPPMAYGATEPRR